MINVDLPIHLAVHYLGCVRSTDDGIAVPGLIGPSIAYLAECVDRLTVVAYDPPASPGLEDLTDHVIRSPRGRIDALSLGPKGTWKDLLHRRRHVARVVGGASAQWDVVLFRLPNRRAGTVWRASRCPRVVTVTGGHTPSVVRRAPLAWKTKLASIGAAWLAERQMVRIMRSAGVATFNSEPLIEIYASSVPDPVLVRSSNRRERFAYLPADRLEHGSLEALIVGRLTGAKGVYEALDAFAAICENFQEAKLHVAGEGDATTGMRARASKLGIADRVVFHGWVSPGDELFDLYRRCDVLLHLSHAESFPRAVWEAMAHGTLVICTPVGGLVQAFEHEREVMFVDVGGAAGAADAVMKLARDDELRRRMILAASDRAGEATLERTSADLLSLVRRRWPELLASNGEVS